MDRRDRPLLTQRAVLIYQRLEAGETLNTGKLAQEYGIHRSTAYRTLCDLSELSTVPLTEDNGDWYLIRHVAQDATTT